MDDMKNIWYQYLVDHKEWWCSGFTKKRLEKVKDAVLSNEEIMWDLMHRHEGKNMTPEQMEKNNLFMFNHGFGNLASSVFKVMHDKKMVK
jgi:hypothetical protein